ncbi:MAG: S9 family peptidase, partial [Chloroflexi bacterium]|nr:S9 family peptidase [Chloroflexota bacterium]
MSPTTVTVAPFGSWASPFKIERLTDRVVFLAEARAVAGRRYWLEGRPEENGRQVLVRREVDGTLTRLTPEGFNARSRVHEYGGGATLVSGDLVVVSDFATGRLHRVVRPGELVPITPDRQWRFADAIHDARHDRLIAVREDHEPETLASHGELNNELVAIDLSSGDVSVLAGGSDFYAAPRLSPDGHALAWLEWHHPNMPWDGTELRLAGVATDGSLVGARTIAGSRRDWISQPRWSPEGILHFAAEPTGWMNICRYVDDRIEQVTDLEAELVGPDWQFGYRSYAFLPDGDIVSVARSDGRDNLIRITWDGEITPIDIPYTEISWLSTDGELVLIRAAGPASPVVVAEVDLAGNVEVLRRATPFEPELEDT